MLTRNSLSCLSILHFFWKNPVQAWPVRLTSLLGLPGRTYAQYAKAPGATVNKSWLTLVKNNNQVSFSHGSVLSLFPGPYSLYPQTLCLTSRAATNPPCCTAATYVVIDLKHNFPRDSKLWWVQHVAQRYYRLVYTRHQVPSCPIDQWNVHQHPEAVSQLYTPKATHTISAKFTLNIHCPHVILIQHRRFAGPWSWVQFSTETVPMGIYLKTSKILTVEKIMHLVDTNISHTFAEAWQLDQDNFTTFTKILYQLTDI